jgi:transposase-like protein
MKLHRDLNITQKSAWFMLHRLREAWGNAGIGTMAGPVEADETYVGGKRKTMSNRKRKELRGIRSRVPVVGVKDRTTKKVAAEAVYSADRLTVQFFIEGHVANGATVYTDESKTYDDMPFHEREAVKHSAGEYVRGDVHTNGIESFWSMFKRGYVGTYHHMSEKHLQRYVDEFTGRQCVREEDTAGQMASLVAFSVGKRLLYKDLIAD